MIPLPKNAQTDGRMDGRTDRPYFIRPFRLMPGVQKTCGKHWYKQKTGVNNESAFKQSTSNFKGVFRFLNGFTLYRDTGIGIQEDKHTEKLINK